MVAVLEEVMRPQAALAACAHANSLDDMRQAVEKYPFMADAGFIQAVEQVIMERVSPDARPAFEEHLAVLKQIVEEQGGEPRAVE